MVKKWMVLLVLLVVSTASDYVSTYYTPILMERADLESSIQLYDSPKLITNPGTLCLYQNWVLLVENYKGVHLIDNSDPANPVNKGFLTIPGCMNVTVRNDVFYVNSAVDLVGIRVDLNALTAVELSRQEEVLPVLVSPDGHVPYSVLDKCTSDGYEVVGWIRVNATRPVNTYYYE